MLPVRSYSVRAKRRNREAAASFRKNQATRRKPITGAAAAGTSGAAHAPARRTVSAGATVPSESAKASSPSGKSVSSEPGVLSKEISKIETVMEEPEDGKEEGEEEEKKEEEEGGVLKKEGEPTTEGEGPPVEKTHVKFEEEPDQKENDDGDDKKWVGAWFVCWCCVVCSYRCSQVCFTVKYLSTRERLSKTFSFIKPKRSDTYCDQEDKNFGEQIFLLKDQNLGYGLGLGAILFKN